MFNSNTLEEAISKRNDIIDEYIDIAPKAMNILDEGFDDATNVMCLPIKYRKVFPNTSSAIRLLGSVLMDHHDD